MCVCRELMVKLIFVWSIVYILRPWKYAGNMRGGCSVYIRAFISGLGVDSVESLICFSWFDLNGVSEDCMRKWGNVRNWNQVASACVMCVIVNMSTCHVFWYMFIFMAISWYVRLSRINGLSQVRVIDCLYYANKEIVWTMRGGCCVYIVAAHVRSRRRFRRIINLLFLVWSEWRQWRLHAEMGIFFRKILYFVVKNPVAKWWWELHRW